jgi:hypothetical protein
MPCQHREATQARLRRQTGGQCAAVTEPVAHDGLPSACWEVTGRSTTGWLRPWRCVRRLRRAAEHGVHHRCIAALRHSAMPAGGRAGCPRPPLPACPVRRFVGHLQLLGRAGPQIHVPATTSTSPADGSCGPRLSSVRTQAYVKVCAVSACDIWVRKDITPSAKGVEGSPSAITSYYASTGGATGVSKS